MREPLPVRRIFLMLLAVLMFWLVTSSEASLLTRVTVVRPDADGWLADHAAGELSRYAERMTGSAIDLIEPEHPFPNKGPVFVLSLGDDAARRLEQLPGADDAGRLRDGFVIRSMGNGLLSIAAKQPIGLLYGVYDYLERHCGCGFFWDGDYVPSRHDLPVDGIDEAIIPRWPVRYYNTPHGFGLSKFHSRFRTTAHNKQILDWMAKRKINRTGTDFGPSIVSGGLAATKAFGISDTEPDNFTFTGWPGTLGWPAQVRTQVLKSAFGHGRRRGIQFIYQVAYGHVPHQFRKMYPDYRYVGHLGYSATALYPDDPACDKWSKAYVQALIELYGTDHIYMNTPFVESTGAADLEESFQLKLAAAQRMCHIFKQLDPEAIWQWDSWDFGAQSGVWTADRIKRYFNNLPTKMMRVYDTASILNPFYKRTNYFEGALWTFGILHSFQGDDHLHGNLSRAFHLIQELSSDPKADRCEGIYHIPETTGHNILYFDVTTNLTWSPNGTTLDRFLDSYVKRRYGAADAARMRKAVASMVQAVHRGDGQVATGGNGQPAIYQKFGCHYGPTEWWPVIDDKPGDHPARFADSIAPWRTAIRLALSCRRTQQGNSLYVNDMVDWTRDYLAHVFNWATINAYDAFKARQVETMDQMIATARQCLRLIEPILSTRPDFSLQAQIERVMRVPGTNPYLPWYIKKHQVNDLYSNNEVYEQLHWFYAPRMEIYFRELEQRATKGIATIHWGDVADRCEQIRRRWLEEDIAVPEDEKFEGTTMEAVVNAVEAIETRIEGMNFDVETVEPWPQKREVHVDYRSDPAYGGLRERGWEDGPIQRHDGYVRSPAGTSDRSRYVYFQINDQWCFDAPAEPPMNLILEVEMAQPARIQVEYDSHDTEATLRGAYTRARRIEPAEDGATSRVHRFHMSAVRLANRQNGGSDFRLMLHGPEVNLLRVSVTSANVD